MKKTGVRKAQTPPFFRPDDCAKTGRKPTCRRGAGNETCGCRTKQERPLQPQIALSPRFTERLHDRPGKVLSLLMGNDRTAFNSNWIRIRIFSPSKILRLPFHFNRANCSRQAFPYPGSQSQRKL